MEVLKREALEQLDYHVQNPHLLIAQTVRDGDSLNTKYIWERYQNEPLQLGRTGDGVVVLTTHMN